MIKLKAQAQIALLAALGAMIVAAVSISVNANLKADKSIDRVSAVEGDIKSIQRDLNAINEKVGMLTDYFKLVPKNNLKK